MLPPCWIPDPPDPSDPPGPPGPPGRAGRSDPPRRTRRFAGLPRWARAGAVAAVWACTAGPSRGEEITRRVAVMGTVLSMRVQAPDRAAALEAGEAALRAIESTEQRLTTWSETSELSRLNAAARGVTMPLSAELAADLAAARRWWRSTGGAFDPALGSLVRAWGLREGGRIPGEAERTAAVRAAGMNGLRLEGRFAVRLRGGLRIEEGAFGKGRGLDAARGALEASAATAALLDLGGQVLLYGNLGEVAIGVAHPRRRGEVAATLRIASGSLATTGNSERGFTMGGQRYSHVLDPRRGRPCPDWGSVTVWAPSATAADCLSTALYVMGPVAAIAWAERHPGIEALALEVIGGGEVRARESRGLRGLLLEPGIVMEGRTAR